MALSNGEVAEKVKELRRYKAGERDRLERVRLYLSDFDYGGGARPTNVDWRIGPLRWLSNRAPLEVRRLAEISRVNFLKFVVSSEVQAMYVDGFRAPAEEDEAPVWETWLRNGMTARQVGIHRSTIAYGTSYVVVLPGDPVPVMRAIGPRKLCALYGDDDVWPTYALEERPAAKGRSRARLYDSTNVYDVEGAQNAETLDTIETSEHGAGVTPVIRYRLSIPADFDDPAPGEVEPLLALQDQINITTFGLLVAQHYGAFRQRYILGWMAKSEEEGLTASARKLWTFDDPDVTVGEFNQTDLSGYLESRESTLRHVATVSQTPAHELLGQLANLSAEALAAAEASHRRKVSEHQTTMGESHDQTLELAARLQGVDVDPLSSIRWRDTEARSLSQAVDAWGKAVQMLSIPAKEVWDKLPNVTQNDLERWRAAAAEGDALGVLASTLERQATARASSNGETRPITGTPVGATT